MSSGRATRRFNLQTGRVFALLLTFPCSMDCCRRPRATCMPMARLSSAGNRHRTVSPRKDVLDSSRMRSGTATPKSGKRADLAEEGLVAFLGRVPRHVTEHISPEGREAPVHLTSVHSPNHLRNALDGAAQELVAIFRHGCLLQVAHGGYPEHDRAREALRGLVVRLPFVPRDCHGEPVEERARAVETARLTNHRHVPRPPQRRQITWRRLAVPDEPHERLEPSTAHPRRARKVVRVWDHSAVRPDTLMLHVLVGVEYLTNKAVRLASEDGESVLARVNVVEDMVVGHRKRTLTYDLEVDNDVEAPLQLVAGGESLMEVRRRILATNAGGVEVPIVHESHAHGDRAVRARRPTERGTRRSGVTVCRKLSARKP